MRKNLYTYEYVRLPFEDILQLLEHSPTAILQPASEVASAHAHEVSSVLVVPLGGFELSRDVTVSVGDIKRAEPTRATMPLQWHATQRQGLFPEMEAELEIAALSREEPLTQVSCIGSYIPPVGVIGAVGDSAGALHRLAEASVHRLVQDICNRLAAELQA